MSRRWPTCLLFAALLPMSAVCADRPNLEVTRDSPWDVTIRNNGPEKAELVKITANGKCELRFYDGAPLNNRFEPGRQRIWWAVDTKDKELESPKELTQTLEPGGSTVAHFLTSAIPCGDEILRLELSTPQGVLRFTFKSRAH